MRCTCALFCLAHAAWCGTMVRSVKVVGTSRPLELETRAGAVLDDAAVTRDVRRIWATASFEDVRVERSGTADVVFKVIEKRRTYLRRVESEPANEKRRLKIERGVPIDNVVANGIASALRRQLVEEGHPDARVDASLVPVGVQEVDLRLRFDEGPRRIVGEVRFSGNSEIRSNELRRELRALRVRRMIPGIWTSRPPLSDAAVESDLARMRSFYLSRGYLDAQVRIEDTGRTGNQVGLTVHANPGPKYTIRQAELLNLDSARRTSFAYGELCACVLGARRAAGKEGRLDFDVELRAGTAPGPGSAALRAFVKTGPAYTLGRLDFNGNHSLTDATIRRAFVLNEGDVLDAGRLSKSLARVNQLGLFEPIGGDSLQIIRDPVTRRADVVLSLKQHQSRRWSLSGPAGPVSFAGPLQASIASRLPAWGKGVLEASTYSLSLSISAFAGPVSALAPFAPRRSLLPLIALGRPFLPGQTWQSGFVLAPQLGLKGMAASYGLAHLHAATRAVLRPEAIPGSELAIPFIRETGSATAPAGVILCDAPKPRWYWLRAAATYTADLVLGSGLL